MAKARTGGFSGWVSDLARDYSRQLAAIARYEGLSSTDAVDAVQEALCSFLGLPQARALVEEPDESGRLLSVLVRNIARNMRRLHHRARPHVDIDETPAISEDPSAEELIARAEAHVRLVGCVTYLGALQRHVVRLRMVEQLSARDAAEELGLTPGHVAVLLHRAKKALEECLSSHSSFG